MQSLRRRIGILVVGIAAISASVGAVQSCRMNTRETVAPHSNVTDHALHMSGQLSRADLQKLARNLGAQLERLQVPSDRVRRLESDIEVIIWAFQTPDFDAYDRLLVSKGLSPHDLADGFTDGLIEWGVYDRTVAELQPSRSRTEKLRFIWNSPSPRSFKWVAIDTESPLAGTGLVSISGTPSWPYDGYYAQMSMYAPRAGRLTETEGARVNKTHESAWILLKVRFEENLETGVRINFYYDAKLGTWVPSSILLGNNWKDVRPIPVL
jgi:hypothetical protein